ncbi:MAG: thioredoxin domain-containing protein [Nitrososphaerota archaeon]|nr:thioredoxin domain-containing protein [Nitrososphaerota archaeon]
MENRPPNRLAKEKSPYLLEHAYNPVDWWPWCEEALAKAKNDGKPIFLSIGYSTCHWCHVLAKESFEDPKTAAFINKNFIPIKVDREERPEVDAYYMAAVQAMTGGGGWPLSVFLAPGLEPFYGGTYFPPEPRQGMPSFMQVLQFVANLWKEKRSEVSANAQEVSKAVQGRVEGPAEPAKEALDECYAGLMSSFDSARGGFSTAPKFPLPITLGFLLRYHFRTGNELAKASALKTLDEMMAGGIRDHLGGGFHRYSTDRAWLVPHFEKMLYDNALLARVYAEGYQLAGKPEYATVAQEALGWIVREMENPEGGFYSAQDADTAEGEGAYYSWTPQEVIQCVGEADGEAFNRVYGVTRTGNFDGRSLLHLDPGRAQPKEDQEAAARARPALYSMRLTRPRPKTDTKVLTSWNGLAISALAYAGGVLRDDALVAEASRAADFVLGALSEGGRLLRRYADGEAALPGTLEDYAFFVMGLLDLFEATGDPDRLRDSLRLTGTMLEFEDKGSGGFYMALEQQPARLKESYDGPTPSGNSAAVLDLVRLAELTGKDEFRKAAERTLRAFGSELSRNATGHACMLTGLDLLVNGSRQVVVTASGPAEAKPFVEAAYGAFSPDRVLVVGTGANYPALSKISPLLEGRKPGAKPLAYVCVNGVCSLPAGSAADLASQLGAS